MGNRGFWVGGAKLNIKLHVKKYLVAQCANLTLEAEICQI